MAQPEQINIFVSRLLATVFGVASALFAYNSLTEQLLGVIGAQALAMAAVLVLGSLRARVGAKSAYAHPLGVLTIILLLPAQFATLLLAFALV